MDDIMPVMAPPAWGPSLDQSTPYAGLKGRFERQSKPNPSWLAAVLPSGGVSRRQTETGTVRGRCWPLNPGGHVQKEPSFWAAEAKKEGEVDSRRGMDRLTLCALYSDCQPQMQSDSLYLTLSGELQRNCYTQWGGCHLWACHTCSEGPLVWFLYLSCELEPCVFVLHWAFQQIRIAPTGRCGQTHL